MAQDLEDILAEILEELVPPAQRVDVNIDPKSTTVEHGNSRHTEPFAIENTDAAFAALEATGSFTDPSGTTYTGKIGLSAEEAQKQAIAVDIIGL